MARIRTIKPEYWDSPAMAGMDPWARLLFIAMWNWADDSGRGTADPKQLSGFAFPKDEDITSADIRRMLGEIRRGFGVVFYEVGGRPYYYIPSWDRHQKIDKRSAAKHPAPEDGHPINPDPSDRTWEGADQQGRRREEAFGGTSAGSSEGSPNARRTPGAGTGEQGNRGTGTTRPANKPLDTDALFGEDQAGTKNEKPKRPSDAQVLNTIEWQEFWKAYPRHEGRAPAIGAWVRAVYDRKVEPATIIAGALAYARRMAEQRTEPSKVKMAQGWLNDRRWEDEPSVAAAVQPVSNAPKNYAADERCPKHRSNPRGRCGACRADALAAQHSA